MAILYSTLTAEPDPYCGLRLTADQFLKIPDDGRFYELIDGVVQRSPSPTPDHKAAMIEITEQLYNFLLGNLVGRLFAELDIPLGAVPNGGDLVYRPEIIFMGADRARKMRKKIVGAPELVVEVVSAGSRRMDLITKKARL